MIKLARVLPNAKYNKTKNNERGNPSTCDENSYVNFWSFNSPAWSGRIFLNMKENVIKIDLVFTASKYTS